MSYWFVNKWFLLMGLFVLLTGLCVSGVARAEPLNVDVADDYVEITSGFTGTDLVVFGNKGQSGDVVVVLEGPERDSVVRRKERTFGAWINRASLRFENTPLYYDYALSADSETDFLSETIRKDRRLGLSSLMFTPEKKRYDAKTTKLFQEALIRNQQKNSLYPLKPQKVSFLGDDLFRADFHLPANVPSGEYKVRALLVHDGQIVYEQVEGFQVGLTGFSAGIYKFAMDYSFLYGLLCVGIACIAGWLSNTFVQRN